VYTVHECDGQTDRQTDRRTDRITIAKTVQRIASHGRNLSSAGNPNLEPTIGELVAKLWPFCISRMPVSRHLGFYGTHIAPFDPPTPKTIA